MTYPQNATPKFLLALSVATMIVTSPVLLPTHVFAQDDIQVMGRRQSTRSAPPVIIDDAINIIGFEGIKPGGKGRLEIGEDGIRLVNDNSNATIPANAVSFFALDHSTKALLRGAPGVLASLAPNGAGQIYSAIRPGAETLTLFYRDENNALHGAVILLPKASKDEVIQAFARFDLEPGEGGMPEAPAADAPRGQPRSTATSYRPAIARGQRPAVHIALPRANDMLPPSFTVASYEALITQARKSGLFGEVWREGDVRTENDALRLSLDVTEYKKGNAGVRGAIPVAGMIAGKTLIRADLRLDDASGEMLFEQEVKGSKRMMGESIAASTSLAQRATKALAKAPGLAKGTPLPDEPTRQMALNDRRPSRYGYRPTDGTICRQSPLAAGGH